MATGDSPNLSNNSSRLFRPLGHGEVNKMAAGGDEDAAYSSFTDSFPSSSSSFSSRSVSESNSSGLTSSSEGKNWFWKIWASKNLCQLMFNFPQFFRLSYFRWHAVVCRRRNIRVDLVFDKRTEIRSIYRSPRWSLWAGLARCRIEILVWISSGAERSKN